MSNNDWPLPFAEPEEVGMSSVRLSSIKSRMQEFIDNEKDPNFNTMVVRKGKVVYHEAQGYMNIETKKPAQKDTIYRLWSNTKPITGVATMICLEEGRLRLEWISAAEGARFAEIINEFTDQVRKLGPSPLAVRRQTA